MAVSRQEADPDSPLHFARKLLKFRKQNPVLARGEIEFPETESDDSMLAFFRNDENHSLLCVFNLKNQQDRFYLEWDKALTDQPFGKDIFARTGTDEKGRYIDLPPYGFFIG
jgi:glycosidase